MKKVLLGILVLLLLGCGVVEYFIRSMGNAEFWESSIRKFEESDRVHPPKPGCIVFVGSSSIRFWHTLGDDMKPLEVINRGFGGSQIAQVNHYARRIAIPYRPRAIVLYAGENDLSWPWSKSPETVLDDFKRFVEIIHAELPETWIYYVSMKPSPLRWSNWETLHTTNQMIEAFTRSQERVQFIDVSAAMLDAQGRPRRELFRWDRLHLNLRGYALWTSIIRPVLLKRFAAGESGAASFENDSRGSQNSRHACGPPRREIAVTARRSQDETNLIG
jgi:lysophospholipase L1-like esterase